MAVQKIVLATLLVAAGAAKKKQIQPSADCAVTSTYPDGTELKRDCYVLDAGSKE